MPTVWIPPLLRDLTQGRQTVTVPGENIRQVIEALDRDFPGTKGRLCDENGLRPGITVAIDTEVARLGLSQPVGSDTEVHFLPALGGGQDADGAPPVVLS